MSNASAALISVSASNSGGSSRAAVAIAHGGWSEARTVILAAAGGGPRTLALIGDPGTGKTWLLRDLVPELRNSGRQVKLLPHGDAPFQPMPPGAALLVDEASRLGRNALAQLISQQRGLVILADQPPFGRYLQTLPLPPTLIFLQKLDKKEIKGFVLEWLAAHDAPASVSDAGFERLAVHSDGTPRVIAQLLNGALALAATSSKKEIAAAEIDEVAALRFGELGRSAPPAVKQPAADAPAPPKPTPTPEAEAPAPSRPMPPPPAPVSSAAPAAEVASPSPSVDPEPLIRPLAWPTPSWRWVAVLIPSALAVCAAFFSLHTRHSDVASQPAAVARPALSTAPARTLAERSSIGFASLPAPPPLASAIEPPTVEQPLVAAAPPPSPPLDLPLAAVAAPTAEIAVAPEHVAPAEPLQSLTLDLSTTPAIVPNDAASATSLVAPSATPAVDPSPTSIADLLAKPIVNPSPTPTADPSATPTVDPSPTPIADPSATPTVDPPATPVAGASAVPTVAPSATSLVTPSATPTVDLPATPVAGPSATPTIDLPATPVAGPSATPPVDRPATPIVPPPATPTVSAPANPVAAPSAAPIIPPGDAAAANAPSGGLGLIFIARRGDTLLELYASVYRGLRPPPYAAVLAANPHPVRPGDMVVFPAPPDGWPRR